MQLEGSRALVTGAGGGIGSAMVAALAREGAHVLLVDRDARALEAVMARLGNARAQLESTSTDISSSEERARLCELARTWRGGVNILINNAGLNPFGLFDDLQPHQMDTAIAVNLQAPMHLCHALLPHLRVQGGAAIVNTGSVFGSIGFPGYVTYSTTKFALRGFTEALRRELQGSGVTVQYLAPRATRTSINSATVDSMNREMKVAMDPPERVASELVSILRSGRASRVVGWPEKLFVRINAMIPALVDQAVNRQLPIIRRYARATPPPEPSLRGACDTPPVEIRRQAT